MIRTNHPRDIVKVSNAVIRPNIWLQKEPTDGLEKRFFTYGECRVIVSGLLYEKDFCNWLCMIEMIRQNNNEKYESDQILLDIAKQLGLKNPWQKIPALWDSFDRLGSAQIKIRPEKGQGLSAWFCLIEGWLESDGGRGSFGVSRYKEIIESLILGQTPISIKKLLEIKGSLASALYRYLTSQQPFYSGTGYEIRMSLLCQYLNYDVGERPWWRIKPNIESAIEELKKMEIVGRYKYEKDRQKKDGGVFTFFPFRKTPAQLTVGKANNEIIEIIQKAFPDLMSWSKSDENNFRTILNQTKTYLENKKVESLESFIKGYCNWLQHKKLNYVKPALFKSDNGFFQEYVKFEKEDQIPMLKELPSHFRRSKEYNEDDL